MKAVSHSRPGPAKEVLVYGDLPDPVPQAGEIRVKVGFSGINPSDVKRRSGVSASASPSDKTELLIPNMDGSGVVDRVGPGLDGSWIGKRVWLHSTAYGRPFGTGAEYTVTTPDRAYVLPDGVGMDIGAALGVPAMTAHRSVFGLGPVRGKTVLVTGGAGAVGFYAIQLALWGGARVFATVSSAGKAALATRAGAEAVINYREEDVAGRVMELTSGKGVDLIVDVDFGANLAESVKMIASGGAITSYASMGNAQPVFPFWELARKNIGVLPVLVYSMPAQAMVDAGRDVNLWLASGRAGHNISQRFSLEQLADAHLAVEAAAVGKVVVEVGGENVSA